MTSKAVHALKQNCFSLRLFTTQKNTAHSLHLSLLDSNPFFDFMAILIKSTLSKTSSSFGFHCTAARDP